MEINKNKLNKELFDKIFLASEKQLLKFLPNYLEKTLGYKKVMKLQDFIYAKGSIPILLVAHLDTVFSNPPKIAHANQLVISTNGQGLGSDDRAGVFSILEIAKTHTPYILFTTQEEIGGVGAKIAGKKISLPNNIKYIIELDRQGFNDCVFYENDNKAFQAYIETFGFKTKTGSFSDISYLMPAWDISGVNLSIGYYNQHTSLEVLNLDHMFSTIEKVKTMLENPPKEKYYFIEKIYKGYTNKLGVVSYDYDYGYKPSIERCDLCTNIYYDDELQIVYEGNSYLLVCPDCLEANYFECQECGELTSKKNKSLFDENICQSCTDKLTLS